VLVCGIWRGGERIHAQDGCAASDIEDDLVLEQVRVLVDSVAVALGSDFIFLKRIVSRRSKGNGREGQLYQHLLVDTCIRALVSFTSSECVCTDHGGCSYTIMLAKLYVYLDPR